MRHVDSAAATLCRNCEQSVAGRYCASCGQETADDPTFGRMMRDFAAEVINLDSRGWRTVALLFARPGFLSAEYRAGRRQRYLSPMRVYLVASVVFFGAVALAPIRVINVRVTETEAAGAVRVGAPGDAGRAAAVPTDAVPPAEATPAADGAPAEAAAPAGRIEARLDRAMAEPERLNRIFVRSLAWAMFVLIPLFALLLKALFRDARTLYVHHVAFALHYHAFGFALMALGFVAMHLLDHSAGGRPADVAFITAPHAGSAAYLYLATRRFYAERSLRTLAKLGVLGFGYVLALVLVSAGTAAFAIALL
jgi:hypothetical protein